MNINETMSFGKTILQSRRKKRLSQRDVADLIGVDHTYLSKLENDRVEPSPKIIDSLAKHLELNTEELTYLAGKMTQQDSQAFEELIKANPQEMNALFRRVRENPSLDSLVKAREEQIAKLQKENQILKIKLLEATSELKRLEKIIAKTVDTSLIEISQLREVIKGRDLTNWRHLYGIADELGVTISNLVYHLQELGWIYIPKGSKQIFLEKIALNDDVLC
ncbi:helix-turn-helix domain-containing protein [Crocosphaera sp. XPORK-15E]|uniref:helix-turn-helix domain-containing protein n=1 Tax=Crocosphaera sp. XPORK-15E TaxID=3110247 RepID=UPI002B204E05|nr:helix-turn-helix domain-containing protein [Crocosphaera sp. XPORK-15E]MEA5533692.1 helix-turn-helix domain-containing protein [Crocosphaera sp. XPORK-15E]